MDAFRRSGISNNDTNSDAFGYITNKGQIKKLLKIPLLHVVIFFLSWTPYTVLATWWVSQKIYS